MTKNLQINAAAFAASVFLLLTCFTGSVAAQQSKAVPVLAGHVTHLSGILSVKRADGQTRILAVQSEVFEGDTLTTEQDAYARVKFVDEAEVVLRPQSQLVVSSYRYNEAKPEGDSIIFNMIRGGLRAVTGLLGKRNKESVKFNTPTATIGIRGTFFGALLCQGDCGGFGPPGSKPPENGLHVDVTSGAIIVTNSAGQVLVNAGQFGFVPAPDVIPRLVPAESGIKILLPTSVSRDGAGGRSVSPNKDAECVAQ